MGEGDLLRCVQSRAERYKVGLRWLICIELHAFHLVTKIP